MMDFMGVMLLRWVNVTRCSPEPARVPLRRPADLDPEPGVGGAV